MSAPLTLSAKDHVPLRDRLAARLAVAVARPLAALPAGRLRRLLCVVRRGASPATPAQALAARQAVVAVSTRCAGQNCLQRSVATALMCRTRSAWPVWCVGVRTQPFRAHAWVEVDGLPVGEPHAPGYYHLMLAVGPPTDDVNDETSEVRHQA
ncbi:lasso peptide biosynthesis B2 protein [Streptomyces sp. NPDC048045]|uniref:lasso peptide biosynthesis B2 protein n=1 Tax=Streptomyces sp. NPDC048045 TaxID=3154710 RepID=UPI00343913D3